VPHPTPSAGRRLPSRPTRPRRPPMVLLRNHPDLAADERAVTAPVDVSGNQVVVAGEDNTHTGDTANGSGLLTDVQVDHDDATLVDDHRRAWWSGSMSSTSSRCRAMGMAVPGSQSGSGFEGAGEQLTAGHRDDDLPGRPGVPESADHGGCYQAERLDRVGKCRPRGTIAAMPGSSWGRMLVARRRSFSACAVAARSQPRTVSSGTPSDEAIR
jgi:hypothetical protein